ncbi:MAG: lytic transglycosylase domain-containing protein [Clostridiaceae bacterium]|nr:lytic transglycosylase domain-containing protein [Clostridiaceae bacterium]MBW4859577.1 lytic transglycosylase domain-containing protein [Clostridiaceae bacterium]MBW4868546.1 lytic transglycosylase domain-containing protein [Clostridiaceae bacterium]
MNYKKYIHVYSQKYNIDPYLVAAIINVESDFEKDACSKKDARGLMQVSPTTGNWAAKELNLKDFTLESLYDPEINIMIGSWYLNVLNEEFDGNLPLVLAAYNGGSGNVNKWLKDSRYSEDGKSLKHIPFKETSDYVEKVLDNYEKYKKIYSGTFENTDNLEETLLDKNINILKKTFKDYLKNM